VVFLVFPSFAMITLMVGAVEDYTDEPLLRINDKVV